MLVRFSCSIGRRGVTDSGKPDRGNLIATSLAELQEQSLPCPQKRVKRRSQYASSALLPCWSSHNAVQLAVDVFVSLDVSEARKVVS